MGDSTLNRRRFIGFGIAAAGTAAVVGPGSWAHRASLSWDSERGFPGRPSVLCLSAPDLPEGAEVEIELEVAGPDPERSVITLQSLHVKVSGGKARVELPLTYPYEGRVAGRYLYHARATWRSSWVHTHSPATYRVMKWLPLS